MLYTWTQYKAKAGCVCIVCVNTCWRLQYCAHTHTQQTLLHSVSSRSDIMPGHASFSSLLSWVDGLQGFTVTLRLRPVSFLSSLANETPFRLSSRAIWENTGRKLNITFRSFRAPLRERTTVWIYKFNEKRLICTFYSCVFQAWKSYGNE